MAYGFSIKYAAQEIEILIISTRIGLHFVANKLDVSTPIFLNLIVAHLANKLTAFY